jgi:hypothetical protein
MASRATCAISTAAKLKGWRRLCVAEDHAQQIVEVMGDAAGQRAEGFHLLRLAQLRFEVAALGDILEGAVYARNAAIAVALQLTMIGDVLGGAVAGDDARFDIEVAALGQGEIYLLVIVVAILGVEIARIVQHARHVLRRVDAEDAIHLVRPPHRAARFVETPGADLGDVLRFVEPLEQQ